MAEIAVKRTTEITDAEWQQIAEGFNGEFDKNKTGAELKKFYTATVLGYSYHAIAWQDGEVAGHTTCVPFFYRLPGGQQVIVGLSGGTFVRKKFRADIFIFKDMYYALRTAGMEENMVAIVGVSNKNSHQYAIKLLHNKFLFNLPYYILPVRPSAFVSKKVVKYTDWLYTTALKAWLACMQLPALFFNPKERSSFFTIEYPAEIFRLRFNDSYSTVSKGKYSFTYKVFIEKGIRIAYIFEFSESGNRSFRALLQACRHIINSEKPGAVAFVGKLKLRQFFLVKLPAKYEPQPLSLSVNLLVPPGHDLYKPLQEAENWNFSLLNFDVR